jgi:hypothetical protein
VLELKRSTPRCGEWPALRCRPGDLAMVTRSIDYQGRDRDSLGMVFRVLTVEPSPLGNPCWTYEGPRQVMHFEGQTWRIDSIADACLTPLRGELGSSDEAMSSSVVALRRVA